MSITYYRQEFNMGDPQEEGRIYEYTLKTKEEVIKHIEDEGRLDWWFENHAGWDDDDDYDKEEKERIKKTYGWDEEEVEEMGYYFFKLDWDLFWKFYKEEITLRPVNLWYDWTLNGFSECGEEQYCANEDCPYCSYIYEGWGGEYPLKGWICDKCKEE